MSSLRSVLEIVRVDGAGSAELLEGALTAEVGEIRFVEHLAQLSEAGAGSLVVLDRDLSHVAESYRLDIAVRRVSSQGVVALALFAPPGARISMTGRSLARKSGLALIRFDPLADVTALLQGMARQVVDELHLTVDRARRASEAIGRIDTRHTSLTELVEMGSVLLGREVRLGAAADGHNSNLLTVPAVVASPDGPWLVTERVADPDADALLEMVLWRLAAEASRCAIEQERAEQFTRRTAGEVLLQLVEADQSTRISLIPTARRVGIPIDGRHVVVRIEFDNLLDVSTEDDVVAYEQRERLSRLVLEATKGDPGVWHVAHEPTMLVVLWSDERPPRPDSGLDFQRTVNRIIGILLKSTPGLRVFCGVGTARVTLSGLVTSATEARLAASSARSRRRLNQAMSFDAVGLRTTLVEWYSSPSVRESIDSLFAPMNALADGKRESLVETLTTYLDFQGSVSQTAEVMHLHRNAVRYRIKRAFEILDIDESDPDQRLFLHLACRARRPGTADRS